MAQSSNAPNSDQPEPPRLRFLRRLVIGLTVTMIVGLITIVTLIVMTFLGTREETPSAPQLTDKLELPDGQRARAYTQGTDWSAVVTRDNDGVERIHIFDPSSGKIRQTIEIVAD